MTSLKITASIISLFIFSLATAMDNDNKTPDQPDEKACVQLNNPNLELVKHVEQTHKSWPKFYGKYKWWLVKEKLKREIRSVRIAIKDASVAWLMSLPIDNRGNTLFHLAARKLDVDLEDFLLERGADFTAHNLAGETPLTVALKALNRQRRAHTKNKKEREKTLKSNEKKLQRFQDFERKIFIAQRKKDEPGFSYWRSLLKS